MKWALFAPNEIGPRESLYLDLIRIVSAQAVVIGHYGSWLSPDALIGSKIQIQNLGVVIFFVLSGYLIFSTLNNKMCQSRDYAFPEFFLDRFSRIYVTFVPALFVVLILDYHSSHRTLYEHVSAFNIYQFVGNLLMLQDFPVFSILRRLAPDLAPYLVTSFGSARPFWTLAVEWWLYLFFGWFILVNLRRGNWSPKAVFVLAALSIVPIMYSTLGRGNGLALFWLVGAAVAVLVANQRAATVPRPVLWVIALGSIFLACIRFAVARDFYDMQGVLFIGVAFIAGIYMARAGENSAYEGRSGKVLRVAAGASFALYAVHYSIMDFALVNFPDRPAIHLAVISFLVSQVVAIFIYFAFDVRHRALARVLKRRFLADGRFH